MDADFTIPVLGFTGWSGAGKTTLLKKLIPLLKIRGLNCTLIKHARHEFDIDQPNPVRTAMHYARRELASPWRHPTAIWPG